jgi:hypothetical protein
MVARASKSTDTDRPLRFDELMRQIALGNVLAMLGDDTGHLSERERAGAGAKSRGDGTSGTKPVLTSVKRRNGPLFKIAT